MLPETEISVASWLAEAEAEDGDCRPELDPIPLLISVDGSVAVVDPAVLCDDPVVSGWGSPVSGHLHGNASLLPNMTAPSMSPTAVLG